MNILYYTAKGLVINYGEGGGGGATKWENHGSETLSEAFLNWEPFEDIKHSTRHTIHV